MTKASLHGNDDRPPFTARQVAGIIGRKLGRKLVFHEADVWEEVDSSIDVTDRVHIQVGTDYLAVDAQVDENTFRSWPYRSSITELMSDLSDALRDYRDTSS